jgi:hypothetical protein
MGCDGLLTGMDFNSLPFARRKFLQDWKWIKCKNAKNIFERDDLGHPPS